MTSIRTTLAGPAAVAVLLAALVACAPADEGDAPSAADPAAPRTTSAPADPPAEPGAGTEAERAAVEAAFRGYYAALLARDFATACSLTAPETQQKLLENLAAQGGDAATCEEALTFIYSSPANAQLADTVANTVQIQEIVVEGDTATITWSADVQGQRPTVTNQLRRIDGQWRLLDTN